MVFVETAIVGGATIVAVSAASAAAYKNLTEPKGDDGQTLEGLLRTLEGSAEKIRQRSAGSGEGYALVDGRAALRERACSPKQVPIFSYGAVAGCAVLLPSDKGDARGLEVTTVLAESWAESCGARPGARLVRVDGVALAGKTADEIRTIAATASRPLWLDIVVPKKNALDRLAPARRTSKVGAHMLL